MKRKMKVIDEDTLPTRIPIWQTLILLLALDHWQAPEWLWIMGAIIILIGWGYALSLRNKAMPIDIFEEKEETRNE